MDALLPPEMALRAEQLGVDKVAQSALKTFVLAVLARARLRGRGKSAPASGARTGRPLLSVDALPYNPADVTYALAKRVLCLLRSTAQFAGETIHRWWATMGKDAYPAATRLFITADGGGSNGSRVRLWKVALQDLADRTGLEISVSHLPPGTSKWNKIEHRMFSFITMNWRGRPLISHEVIVNLIAATTTTSGLRVRSEIDSTSYPAGIKVTDAEMAALNIVRDEFHGEWNDSIRPRMGLK